MIRYGQTSCIEDDEQRPGVMLVDFEEYILERFEYPATSSVKVDTEKYIWQRSPQIRFRAVWPGVHRET